MSLSTVLIANRGEIAVRIARVAADLGMRSIAVYSDVDAEAPHALAADEAYRLPGTSPAETYLNAPAILEIALRAGADCIHPGYGFLSENSSFARDAIAAGLTWIGPNPETIDSLGDKVSARRIAESVGAPLAPGTSDPVDTWEQARDFAEEHGLPIAIKAAFGGGGRGLKVVSQMNEIEDAFESAGREAKEAFGRPECFVEKFLTKPRHVEAQVLADQHGNVAVLGTRDCSTQRRFQKLVEEAPAPFLSDKQREAIVEGAREVCRKAGYVGAGTVEYIVSEDGTVSFLEVNTRVQVEHPVTEAVTGIDIIAEQFRIAAGQPLSFQGDPTSEGHAFEFRINAEDVAHGFVPCPGTVTTFEAPLGPGIRVDAGVRAGSTIPGVYDSLLAKLIVWGPTREVALARARRALREFRIEGVRTVLPFHREIVNHPALTGDHLGIYTDWVDKEYTPTLGESPEAIEEAYTERTTVSIEIDGRLHTVGLPSSLLSLSTPPAASGTAGAAGGSGASASSAAGEGDVACPYTGTLVAWKVEEGEEVSEGQAVATVEAMKMESNVTAPRSGTIHLLTTPGEAVERGTALARIQ
ncbi:acetyl/propionyl/methylcrotonyl-CoA carboxylase subunit alpha [Corynebacterium lowii]|uniref:2-oxoglutarate carboxylase small subunit n=1 Tax=Corynebacterium lowii TaxID=1544413 RepID=A0A0Q0UHM3_9CORY|nr:biotin carboxylase N-terminal domain-containing protein [Corynebacterium lowii]KQB85965.1 2-oxoglutarate carboxylase small subunit [Corynebacterium lowii]MDP9850605.1 acetyl-CoA/propionyl-CoA carboxylase biotin carboxyl carrier protein [Corynebacterium lowii]